MSAIDWDDAYANGAYIPGAAEWMADLPGKAAAFRETVAVQDLRYGDGDREALDLILPNGPPKGLTVFVHGGYWLRTGKSDWTHYAKGALDMGWAVALPGYPLAPAMRISDITTCIGQAVACAAGQVEGPIHLMGHSAGGHLVTRMGCAGGPLPRAVLNRVQHITSISGLHDLRPLMWTAMNVDWKLSEAEALAESPALLRPADGPRFTAWVGGGERPEFLRQSELLTCIWRGLGARITRHVDGQENHFSVLDGLLDPSSDFLRTALS